MLVQSNFGGVLRVLGVPVGKLLGQEAAAFATETRRSYAELRESRDRDQASLRGDLGERLRREALPAPS